MCQFMSSIELSILLINRYSADTTGGVIQVFLREDFTLLNLKNSVSVNLNWSHVFTTKNERHTIIIIV